MRTICLAHCDQIIVQPDCRIRITSPRDVLEVISFEPVLIEKYKGDYSVPAIPFCNCWWCKLKRRLK